MDAPDATALIRRAMKIEQANSGDAMHIAVECAMLERRITRAIEIVRAHPINYGALVRCLEGDDR